jgi:hypothetical protein
MKLFTMTLLFVAVFAASSAPAAAEDPNPLAGSWVFTLETPQGIVSAQATLTVEEDTLRGSISGPNGDLAVTGVWDSVSVRIYASADNEIFFTFEGERATDVMSGTVEMAGGAVSRWSARRNQQ